MGLATPCASVGDDYSSFRWSVYVMTGRIEKAPIALFVLTVSNSSHKALNTEGICEVHVWLIEWLGTM